MKRKAFSSLVLLSILLGIAGCSKRPVPTKTVTKSISRLMEFYEESGQFSGTILVAQDGNILYEDAFGWANRDGCAGRKCPSAPDLCSIPRSALQSWPANGNWKGRL